MKSEVVFEAYRAVCLTKSKSLGPRIIALLTAEIVLAKSTADSFDQLVFSAAEELSDSELEEFSQFALRYFSRSETENRKDIVVCDDGGLRIRLGEETLDSNWTRGTPLSIGPVDLASDVGPWAPKLKTLGLISDEVMERQHYYEADTELRVDQPGVTREITWWLSLSKKSQTLATLVRRASAGKA